MKKLTLLWIAMILTSMLSNAQTTAVDFTLTDCDGISRSLYPIIDSGNVVILVYEHQCSSCNSGATNLKTTINTYYAAYKNIRVMYLDNGGYSCSNVKSWITNHSFIQGPAFAYSNTQSSPYGAGMPVIVVTATNAHKVYIIANNSGSSTLTNVTNLKNAIESAMADLTTGINTDRRSPGTFDVYPNPAVGDKVMINLHNTGSQLISYEITNAAGQIILPLKTIKTANKQEEIDLTGLENGLYFINFNTSEGSFVRKLMISK
jgi:hypothetical protein